MKKFIKSIFLLSIVAFTTFGLISCKDDDETPVTPAKEVKLTDIRGNYTGKLVITQNTDKVEQNIDFTTDSSKVTFNDFPIKHIVKSVIKDDAKTTAAITAMGKIKYVIDHTAALETSKKAVNLTFAPKTFELNIPVDNATKKAVLTIETPKKGIYTSTNLNTLSMELNVTKVTVDGTQLADFKTVTYTIASGVKK